MDELIPVFPEMEPVRHQTFPSSPFTTTNSPRQSRNASYSTRLKQWHHAYSALPETLCPPTAPPSPTFLERTIKLQSEIEQAVRVGRNITDFCKLRCSAFGYATKESAQASLEDEHEETSWILPDTEEEWFEWERMREERRKSKGKEREYIPHPIIQPQSTLDKVLSWKAGLQPAHIPSVSVSASSTNTAQPLLGFPVVKRSTAFLNREKVSLPKGRGSEPRHQPNVPTIQSEGNQDIPVVLQQPSKHIENDHNRGIDNNETPTKVDQQIICGIPLSEPKSEILEPIERSNHSADFMDAALFFPPNLPTSTPKDPTDQAEVSLTKSYTTYSVPEKAQEPPEEPLPSFPQALYTSTPRQEENLIEDETREINLCRTDDPVDTSIEIKMPADEGGILSLPENTAENSAEQNKTNAIDSETMEPNPLDSMIGNETRPTTPPLQLEHCVSGNLQTTPPHTPERILVPSSSRPSRNSQYRSRTRSRPATPEAAINGGVNTTLDMGLILPPQTPERKALTTDPLATSRKSLPRPRPPSRKRLLQGAGDHGDDCDGGAVSEGGTGYDSPPSRSERSYFSSPVSGSSDGSVHVPAYDIPDSPTSPFGFTQNPSRFVPLGESTQSRYKDGMRPLNDISDRQGRKSSQNGSLAGTFELAYNSQYDVDARINDVSYFLEKDVDVRHWIRDTETKDGDVDTIE